MSELVLLSEVFRNMAGKNRLNLKQLFNKIDFPELDPYVGDYNSFKSIFFRLNQEGIIKSRLEGDYLNIEKVDEGSAIHHLIEKLCDACMNSRNIEDFKNTVYTSELNRYFLDEEEIKAVYFHVEDDSELEKKILKKSEKK